MFLPQKKKQCARGHKKSLGGDEYACYLDYDDNITGICVHPKLIKMYTINICHFCILSIQKLKGVTEK